MCHQISILKTQNRWCIASPFNIKVYIFFLCITHLPSETGHCCVVFLRVDKAKEKYRGVFETQKSGDKTSSGEIGLDTRTHASPKVGQDQVSGGVSVLCWGIFFVQVQAKNRASYLSSERPIIGGFTAEYCKQLASHLIVGSQVNN